MMKLILCLLLINTLSGCSMFNKAKEEVNKESDKVEDKLETSNKEGTMNDFMLYLKDKGVAYNNDTVLDSFDFAAKEGISFDLNGEKVYAYRVDTQDETMKKLIKEAENTNKILASQNGVEKEYGASVNNNYLLIYEMQADVAELLDHFQNYKYETNTTK